MECLSWAYSFVLEMCTNSTFETNQYKNFIIFLRIAGLLKAFLKGSTLCYFRNKLYEGSAECETGLGWAYIGGGGGAHKRNKNKNVSK